MKDTDIECLLNSSFTTRTFLLFFSKNKHITADFFADELILLNENNNFSENFLFMYLRLFLII